MQEHARALAERGDATEAPRLSVKILTDRKLDKHAGHGSGAWGSPASEELGAMRIMMRFAPNARDTFIK